MTFGWTLFVSIFTVANILACFWLLWWTRKRRDETATEADTTGHVWDGDLQEYNKPLPKWWLNLFYITIVFAIGYLVLYPGFGGYAGTLNWSSGAQHDVDAAAAEAKLEPLFARFRGVDLLELKKDPEAVALGANVFAANCTTCHGSDGRGARGFPNLMDDAWQWGGEPDAILTTILEGRTAAMPAWGQLLGEQGVTEAAVYVQSLAGQQVDPALAAAGKARFETVCVACHGIDGKGNQALGAPNLTDGAWLYSSDFATIAKGIRDGLAGHMPAHGPIIGQDRARLAAAWVLSHHPDPVAQAPEPPPAPAEAPVDEPAATPAAAETGEDPATSSAP
jgi:cytochrome c oxidase cbb3-type subunit 3